eukprot:gene10502-biopygen7466
MRCRIASQGYGAGVPRAGSSVPYWMTGAGFTATEEAAAPLVIVGDLPPAGSPFLLTRTSLDVVLPPTLENSDFVLGAALIRLLSPVMAKAGIIF